MVGGSGPRGVQGWSSPGAGGDSPARLEDRIRGVSCGVEGERRTKGVLGVLTSPPAGGRWCNCYGSIEGGTLKPGLRCEEVGEIRRMLLLLMEFPPGLMNLWA